jgi:hypothetical protein
MTPDARGRLLAARELVVVDLADATLAALLTSLELEHALDEPPFVGAPPTLRHARALARLALRLRGHLDRYRRAVDAVLVEPVDDIPF